MDDISTDKMYLSSYSSFSHCK